MTFEDGMMAMFWNECASFTQQPAVAILPPFGSMPKMTVATNKDQGAMRSHRKPQPYAGSTDSLVPTSIESGA